MTKKKNKSYCFLNRIIYCSFVFFFLFSCQNEPKKNETSEKKLPYLGKPELTEIVYKSVNGRKTSDTIYPIIPNFQFLNQDSNIVTNQSKSLKGKIWIADFFFTSCTTICPLMTKNMKYVDSISKTLSNEIALLSFSINPDFDTPTILKRYRKKYKITSNNWLFLTGDEKKTHRLGIDNFLVFAERNDDVTDGFAHSGAFTLVDKKGYVRGVYLGTDKKEVDKLIKDVKLLLKE